MRLLLAWAVVAAAATAGVARQERAIGDEEFDHPAGWHTRADVERIRAKVGDSSEPWHSAALSLLTDSSLTDGYQPSPQVRCAGLSHSFRSAAVHFGGCAVL
jgi:hypothetical protein